MAKEGAQTRRERRTFIRQHCFCVQDKGVVVEVYVMDGPIICRCLFATDIYIPIYVYIPTDTDKAIQTDVQKSRNHWCNPQWGVSKHNTAMWPPALLRSTSWNFRYIKYNGWDSRQHVWLCLSQFGCKEGWFDSWPMIRLVTWCGWCNPFWKTQKMWEWNFWRVAEWEQRRHLNPNRSSILAGYNAQKTPGEPFCGIEGNIGRKKICKTPQREGSRKMKAIRCREGKKGHRLYTATQQTGLHCGRKN